MRGEDGLVCDAWLLILVECIDGCVEGVSRASTLRSQTAAGRVLLGGAEGIAAVLFTEHIECLDMVFLWPSMFKLLLQLHDMVLLGSIEVFKSLHLLNETVCLLHDQGSDMVHVWRLAITE